MTSITQERQRHSLFPRWLLWGVATVVYVVSSAAPASAQMVCGNHADIEKRLETGYQEVRTGIGLAGNGAAIELYTSEKGTFTILMTHSDGMSCLLAVGTDFELVKEPTPVGGSI